MINKKKMSVLRKKIAESVGKNQEPEALFSKFADLATSEQLFQLALQYVKRFPDMAANYICRSASPNALAWLKKRSSDPKIKETMKDWMVIQ